MKNIHLFIAIVFIISNLFLKAQCNVIYVSSNPPGPFPFTGTKSNPAALTYATNVLANPGDHIKVAVGSYTLSGPITNIPNNVTLEGGFDPLNNWSKTSLAGATTITRSNTGVQDVGTITGRISAFELIGVTGFRFQDITVEVEDSPISSTFGVSNYGIHLTSCSDYNIIRCQIITGNASDGADGNDGGNGSNGSNGLSGENGDDDDRNKNDGGNGGSGAIGNSGGSKGNGYSTGNSGSGYNGSTGTTSSTYRDGGSGGGGGGGGNGDNDGGYGGYGGGVSGLTGCFTSKGTALRGQKGVKSGGSNTQPPNCIVPGFGSISGANGADGLDGDNGCDGTIGSVGSKNAFWNVGSNGTNGTDGQGGQGGAGGGGGAGEGSCACQKGSGAGGGGGAGGGQGGEGGFGGFGGGSTYAIYLYNNGPNSVINDCYLNTGNPGNGGFGGSGGVKGLGRIGGSGGTLPPSQDYEVGCGGDGGDGGDGGNGGNGGNGTPGENMNIYINGTALTTQDIGFNLAAQPIITMTEKYCSGESITLTGSSSSNWMFGANSNPNSATGLSVSTVYGISGRKDITYGGQDYSGFAYISNLSPDLADAGKDSIVSSNINLYALIPSNGSGTWRSLTSGTNITNVNNPNSPVSLVPGINEVEWTVSFGSCCLPTIDTVSISLTSAPADTILSVVDTICRYDSLILNVSGGNLILGDTWNWYESSCGGIPIGTGPVIKVSPLANTTYFVRAEGIENSSCTSKIIYVKGTIVTMLPFDTVCGVLQPITLNNAVPVGGVYSGIGIVNGKFDPIIAGYGSHVITYSYTDVASGCVQNISDQLVVESSCAEIEEVLKINTFSPNNDAVNDTWNLNLGNYTTSSLTIFNKWGKKVFESNERIIKWDGNFNNKALPSGSYFYILTIDNSDIYKGSITIIR